MSKIIHARVQEIIQQVYSEIKNYGHDHPKKKLIAGIVLTIGMAVDANVLIFERIKEESLKQKKVFQIVKNGFDRAMSTILDANITTLIAAVLLFAFGSGPIRGFSITLSLGVIASMFTALMLTNFLVYLYLSFANKKELKL